MPHIYLTVANDGSFYLLPYLPNKKYLPTETKIFELPDNTPIHYIYTLLDEKIHGINYG